MSQLGINLKRIFDFLFATTLLLLLLPLFAVIALLLFFSSDTHDKTKRAIFFSQPRLGKQGRIFLCYKFRTMYIDAEERLHALLAENAPLWREWHQNQKLKEDPRILPLGRWLRRTSLDELPQLWNVIKGDLSLVGPRPYLTVQREQLGPLECKILSVRPGVTGLWQTSGRNRTTFQERIALDAHYVDIQSFGYDLLLILKTLPQIFLPKDAY